MHQNATGRAERRDANVELAVRADRLRQQPGVLDAGVTDSANENARQLLASHDVRLVIYDCCVLDVDLVAFHAHNGLADGDDLLIPLAGQTDLQPPEPAQGD